MDKDYYKPNTVIMEFIGDSLYYKNLDEERQLAKRKLTYSKDSIAIDTVQIPINKFKIDNDRLQFINSIAHKIVPTDSININSVRDALFSQKWETDQGVFIFEKKGDRLKFIPKKIKGYNRYCFEILSYKNTAFLLKKGNQIACNRDYQFIEQIISVSEKEIVTFGFVDGVFKNIVYKASKVPENLKPAVFQLCNQYINKNNPRDRYYYHGTEYNGGLYHIRKIVDQQYNAPEGSKESGIFQVRFVVNCEGKAGMFEHQAFDYDYKLKKFSEAIGNQILEIVKGMQDWIPGRHPKTDQIIDTYIYLSFRIKDGKIIRIYP
ncbi:hypothetical protein [Aquimarina rubra]|uniref:TonB C-terminal domain-containing protein n=1 Tax=Aquimarina rubra TaxID=1920033 RepID=A0ABW5LKT1_9FLAO